MIKAIAHPTDFSREGQTAFVHALRLALECRCRLDLLHVRVSNQDEQWDRFPRVREVLQRWGVLPSGVSVEDIARLTGVRVRKAEVHDSDAVDGLTRYLSSHPPDLLVMASHGRDGLNRWLVGSVSAAVADRTRIPALILGPTARPFVDAQSGAMSLRAVLVPVALDPTPGEAVRTLAGLTDGLGTTLDFMTVGDHPPVLREEGGEPIAVRRVEGPVVETILTEARQASLIAMPTAGPEGLFDLLRGSTTEQVVRLASCPVLAIPA